MHANTQPFSCMPQKGNKEISVPFQKLTSLIGVCDVYGKVNYIVQNIFTYQCICTERAMKHEHSKIFIFKLSVDFRENHKAKTKRNFVLRPFLPNMTCVKIS